MKNSRKLIWLGAMVVLVAGLSSCSQGAKIDGTLTGVSKADVIVARLDVNRFNVLDTVKTNASGQYSYKLDVEQGNPEFVYLFHNNKQIASLILQKGEKCQVVSDTNGVYSVQGSPESEKMVEVVRNESAFVSVLDQKAKLLNRAKEGSQEEKDLKADISREYIKYYRNCVLYILQNSHSLSSVNVLYQNIGGDMPIFSQLTDAIHFKNIADSLKTVYPNSKYVKALEDEADKRTNYLMLENKLQAAEDVGFIDLAMPDIKGQTVKLSDIDAKVIMLYFWGTDPALNFLNVEVIKPIYEKYHKKGLEIYAICVDQEKAKWASVVKNQKQNWINVCDGLGAASPALKIYPVEKIPASFFIVDGVLSTDQSIKDEASLRRFLDKHLK